MRLRNERFRFRYRSGLGNTIHVDGNVDQYINFWRLNSYERSF
jgi:hypothetical protein